MTSPAQRGRVDAGAGEEGHARALARLDPSGEAGRGGASTSPPANPRVPRLAKAVVTCVAAYALSPVDLIPDFIPVLGYLDDLVVVPLGALLAIRFIPPDLTAEFRREADEVGERPASRAGATMVVALWLLSAAVLLWALVDSTGA